MRHGEVKMRLCRVRHSQARGEWGQVRQGITSCEAVKAGETGVKGEVM